MTTKEIIRELAKQNGTSLPKLETELGFGAGTISKWDKSAPSADKLQAVADYFCVTVDYLLGREIPHVDQDGYYLDPEAAKMAQELYDNPGMRILFDAARNVSADDLKLAAEIIGRMKKEEEHDVD